MTTTDDRRLSCTAHTETQTAAADPQEEPCDVCGVGWVDRYGRCDEWTCAPGRLPGRGGARMTVVGSRPAPPARPGAKPAMMLSCQAGGDGCGGRSAMWRR